MAALEIPTNGQRRHIEFRRVSPTHRRAPPRPSTLSEPPEPLPYVSLFLELALSGCDIHAPLASHLSQYKSPFKMKRTAVFATAIGLATTVAATNTPTGSHRDAVNRRSTPSMNQQGTKRVEPRSPIRWASPGSGNSNGGGGSSNGLRDQATDVAYGIGTDYLEDRTGISLPGRNSGGSGFSWKNRKRSVVEPRGRSNGGGRGGGFLNAVKDTAYDQGTNYIEDQTGINLPDRNGQSSSGGGFGGWWKNRKREVTVDEVVVEVLDQLKDGESKSDEATADALKEIVKDTVKNDDDTSIGDVVEALTEANEDGDSKSKDGSADTIGDILDALSSDHKNDDKDEDKEEETVADKIKDLVDSDSSDSKSSHGDTLEEKLEELEKETSKLDKDDPRAEMIDELIDELIDEAATLDEIPVEYFQYWMAVQSCLDPVHLLTTKGLVASHLTRRGTAPILVTPTKTVKREEEKPAEVKLGLAQPFGAEMAQTSGAGDGLFERATVGYLIFGLAIAMLASGVAF
ncbi:hypothetical protein QBC40DRAFT_226255 [Triangularia verruculosa]|uniref:Uncharacterized protein n=1 Tax=Triangularia verruculosa TaxID=2587418 RepID=A0AAN7AWL7_9PEZI|nr:hypothetical protein QBC40DRAFT_226255 [Triangularia verruculosa]